MNRRRIVLWIVLSLLLLALCALASLCIGSTLIPVWDWWDMEADGVERIILTQLRLPRTLSAIAIGGMLSLSGCMLQGIFKNPLVEPYTLGISGGASLGVAVAFLCGAGLETGLAVAPGILALAGALAVSAVLLLYYRFRPDINHLLLVGIMLGILCSACTTLLMSLSSPENVTRIVYWTMGSLDGSRTSQALFLCGLAATGLFAAVLLSHRINLLSLGIDDARHLGVNTKVLIPVLVILTSCMTAFSVASAGIIGFIGLVVPHILRRLAGNDYRLLVPVSFLCGAAFMLLCDLLARSIIQPSQLPIGVVTGIIGGGLFVYLLLKPKRQSHV